MINYSPKVGEVLECDFGQFQYDSETQRPAVDNYDGRIPPEIVKKRMVIVLNGKLDSGCLVVPRASRAGPPRRPLTPLSTRKAIRKRHSGP